MSGLTGKRKRKWRRPMPNKKMKFEAKIFEEHKELIAIHLPLDPARVWGKQERYFIKGTIGKCPLIGEVGLRRGHHYMLLEEALLKKAKLEPGDTALFVLELRKPTAEEEKSKAGLAWARLGSTSKP
jgi:Domain of unknown function (DUF1905)